MNFGPTELVIVLLIVLVIFGGSKLPKLARSLGQAKNEFERGVAEGSKEADEQSASKPPPSTTA
jgi:sec-independent protein translocase protein TatA